MLDVIKTGLFFLLCIFFVSAKAQLTISGKIVNENTGQPVQGASVYFNGTSVGTSSDATGSFSLHLVNTVNTELVISCVGYELLVYNPKPDEVANKTLLFKLRLKEQQLKDVLIITDALRRKWLDLFEKNFLGITEEAANSKILNRKDIYFTKGDERNGFKAYSDSPLIIINKMLGYKISFELIEFSYEEKSHYTYFYGYTRYEEMGDKKRWIKNRRRCYYGSSMHFYRSLMANDLKKEGYSICLIKKIRLGTNSDTTAKNKVTVKSSPEEMSMAIAITADQIIKPDSSKKNTYTVALNGQLMVQYGKDPASKDFLKNHVMIQGNLPVGFRAFVTSKSAFLSLDKSGIVNNPMDMEYSGYWIYEKAACLLPINYQPD